MDERFESGPGRFDEPKAAGEIEFLARPAASEPSDGTARVLAVAALVVGRTRGSGKRRK